MTPPTFQPRKPFRFRHAPARVPVVPAGTVRVASVAVAGVDLLSAIWTFDADVTDPAGDVAPFVINGLNAADWARAGARTLHFYYTDNLAPGMAWSNPDAAAGVTGTDGSPLAAGSGTVE